MTHAPNPRYVIPSTRKRDTLIAIVAGTVVLGLVIMGMMLLAREPRRPSTNQVTGTIVAKHTREREQEIRVGRKGLNAQETDTGFSFDIRVESQNRTYNVPVPKKLYDSREVGDTQSFIRPPSEQR